MFNFGEVSSLESSRVFRLKCKCGSPRFVKVYFLRSLSFHYKFESLIMN